MKNKFTMLIGSLVITSAFLAGCTTNSDTNLTKGPVETEEKANVVQAEDFLFTANEGGSVSKINVENNEVVATIKIDGAVHNIQTSPDGKIFAVTVVPEMGEGHGDMEMPGYAMFYDIETNELLNKVEVGNHPAHIVFTEDGNYALVSNNEDDTLTVIDAKNFSIVGAVETGSGPHGFRTSSDSVYAYVANMGEDTVSVINIANLKEEKKLVVGETPVTTGITSDGKTLVTTLNSENKLAIVDVESGITSKVDVGIGPAQVYVDDLDQYTYVANQGTEENPSHSLSIVDIKSKSVIATIETGNGAHGVVTSSDGTTAYVTNMFDDTVSVIDVKKQEVIKTISVGEFPNGISITP